MNRQKQGIIWKSVNWDGWQFTRENPLHSIKLGIEEYAILPDEGIQSFRHILEHIKQPQIIVSTGDLQGRITKWATFKSALVEDTNKLKSEQEIPENRYPRPNLPTPYVPPRNELEERIVEMWEDLLGIEKIGIHDNFFELGGHSLLATRLISQLRDMYNVELPLRDLFESPTIVTLGISIAENLESTQSVTSKDITTIQETLKIVEQLSEDEVKAILQENKNQDAIAL
jgi:acyl carrier protein